MDFEQLADMRKDSDRLQALWAKRDSFGLSAEDDAELLTLAERLMPVIESFGQLAEAMMTVLRTAYAQAGKPLGDNDDAMWQWARDRAAEERARLDAEEAQAEQESFEAMERRRLEQRRN